MKKFSLLTTGMLLASPLMAIDMDQMQIFGYGVVNYYNYDYMENYQSKPRNRSKVDMERFILAPQFIIDDNLKIEAEIEFEHGGTGSTMELDTLEEFGEYEHEIEKGGEVVIEELTAEFEYSDLLKFKVGHFVLPIGLNNARHLPNLYFSPVRSRSETRILPNTWHETGISVFGDINEKVHYNLCLVNGLNSEYFDSAGWIKHGKQGQFEFDNADNMAVVGRFDYGNPLGSHIGISGYIGGSGKNRTKAKLNSDATVTILDVHTVFDYQDFKFRGLVLWGKLSDSDKVTAANRNLSNLLGAKRTPVASEALAYSAVMGYNLAPVLTLSKETDVYARYDFVDSMYKTEGFVQDLDRYERTTVSAGLNYHYNNNLVFKAEYASTSFPSSTKMDDLNSFIVGMGMQF